MPAESEGSENKPAEQRTYIITIIAKYAGKTEHLISECEHSNLCSQTNRNYELHRSTKAFTDTSTDNFLLS
jgi:hypothetical protein